MTRSSPWLPRLALVLLPACFLLALAWLLLLRPAIRARHAAAPAIAAQVDPTAAVRQQIGALAQPLAAMARSWESAPAKFSLDIARRAFFPGAAPQLLLLDRNGRVIRSTVPDLVGVDLHDQAFFLTARSLAARQVNSLTDTIRVDNGSHQWRLDLALWLHGPDGKFAGVLVADDTLHAIQRLLSAPAAAALPGGAVPRYRHSRLELAAIGVSAVLVLLTAIMFAWTRIGYRQQRRLENDRALLTAANLQLETARARADAKAAQLEATLAGMSDGVAMLDSELRLAQWNQRFVELAGVPRELLHAGTPMEAMLQAQAETGQFGPVQVELEVARRMSALRALRQGTTTTERLRPDGRILEVRRNRLPDGSFVSLFRDVTERRRSDDALREARALAEAATAAKSRFVAIVSHEIRAPLGALLNALQLLGDRGLPPAQLVLLRIARQSGEALFGLLNDILDMSSMEAGQITLRPSVFLLPPLLAGVVEMFQTQAAERGISLQLDSDPRLPDSVYADPGRLRQVLINLLSNAVKFGVPGQVVLVVRREQDQLHHASLLLAVRDRGPVIEEAGRARLFRPFSRLDLTGGEPLGSGLGLAICRYLVTLMGGEIGCRSWVAQDGQIGNEFWVQVPLAPLPAGAHPRSPGTEPERRLLPRTRVLLVEDIAANQLVTALLLRQEGHLVDVADTGAAALRLLACTPYDLVFTDIHLPGMNGVELARQIRALPGAAGALPIVVLSAGNVPDEQMALERAGITEVLDKPVALPALLQTLARRVWGGRPQHSISLQAPPAPFAAPVLAEQRIGELRAHVPPDALRDMVQECLIDLQGRLPALRSALQAGDTAAAVAQAHAMVGMAAGYGMAALEQRLRALMAAARGPHKDAAAAALEQLETDLAQSANALREALQIEMV